MTIYGSEIWLSDLDEILTTLPELDGLAGKNLLVTGCSGLICSAVIDLLIRWNGSHDKKIVIHAASRTEEELISRFSKFCDEDWFVYTPYDAVSSANVLPKYCDYIIHGASNASPSMITKAPVETMLGNFTGINCLLDYSRKTGARILFISSSEVYGIKDNNKPYQTDEYGFIDLLNSRNSYSVGKRAAETLCVSYADEYGVIPVIVRPGHIYGPTASPFDNRVSSAWAYAVARGSEIVMKSEGAQIRSYCYCLDCASAILKVLLRGKTCHAYNVSNPDSVITIKQMAELLSQSAGVMLRTELPTETERRGFNPMSNSSLDSTELLDLGWRGLFDAERGFNHTVKIIKQCLDR